jgi:glycosyltransferase involved in cell wall biosynthesis
VGPNSGLLDGLQELCNALKLGDAVKFLGPMQHDDIIRLASQASFYLQTSKYEGMAMSVVESMQLGLVPIVTPVGEIGSYCKHDNNAVIIESDQKAIEDVVKLLNADDSYQRLRFNAIETWKDHPLYRESVLKACEALIDDCASHVNKGIG